MDKNFLKWSTTACYYDSWKWILL